MRRLCRAIDGLLLLFILSVFSGCRSTADGLQYQSEGRALFPRYIFYFIGDGMGPAQVALADALAAEEGGLTMLAMPVTGMITTAAQDRYITDSAAAGTALATGEKTSVGTISRNALHSEDLKTIAEAAQERGLSIGIVSSVSIDHATPACFYAHADSRNQYEKIARQMASSGIDYFGGGYALSAQRDAAAADTLRSLMQQSGYVLVGRPEDLEKVEPGTMCWAFGAVDAKGALAYEIDRADSDSDLAFFTSQGIRLLDNPEGFFLMVEGGKIDWACHANDGAAVSDEVLAFDRAIGAAMDFFRRHPDDTLIVVTADHECGGLALGNDGAGYSGQPGLLRYQRISLDRFSAKVSRWRDQGGVSFPMAMDSVRTFFGLGDTALDTLLALSGADSLDLASAFHASLSAQRTGDLYSKSDLFGRAAVGILNRKAGIGWTSSHHTALPVPVYALGQGAELFCGSYDNAMLARKIMDLCGLKSSASQ